MADLITLVNMVPVLSSGESHQDSEANLAVNPQNPLELVGTTFTPSPNAGSTDSPVFYSSDGGSTWSLRDLIAGTPVRDQTVRFAGSGGTLYAGVLWGGGGLSVINFDVLRTSDLSGATTMTSLSRRQNDDQPYVQAATVPDGPDAGDQRVYVGSNDHAPGNIPATMDFSLDAGANTPALRTVVIEKRTVSRDGFQTRPAVHPDGTVYAVYYALLTDGSFDVVIVRDDSWGSGSDPFTALTDPGDTTAGLRIATNVDNPFLSSFLGQQRMGGDLAIAVDPRSSDTVYVCFGDQTGGVYTLYVRRSVDRGATWSGTLRAVANATNPALAIDDHGRLGLLYQQVEGLDPDQRWKTTLELTPDDFGTVTSYLLANTPAASPVKDFDPYLGDYLSMMTVGSTFYGIFTANNTPDLTNFPQGVRYQRNADFTGHQLLDVDGITPVDISIDPFFFSVAPQRGRLVTAVADSGEFGDVCVGSFRDEEITLDNAGDGDLLITGISSSDPQFEVPRVQQPPIRLGPGDATELPIRFRPSGPGPAHAVITIDTDDPQGAHRIRVRGRAPSPRLALLLEQDFGDVCVGSHTDQLLVLNNAGCCPVTVTSITSSDPAFVPPAVLDYPLRVSAGGSLPVPLQFAPLTPGSASAEISVTADDAPAPHVVCVRGKAPTGHLAVTGSLCFGAVPACTRVERTLTLTNLGPCDLHVAAVRFKRRSKFLALPNNPFPATLPPGAALDVVVRYRAEQRCPEPAKLIVVSDDPDTPVLKVPVVVFTDWCTRPDTCSGGCSGGCSGSRPETDCRCGRCSDDECCRDTKPLHHRGRRPRG